MMRKFIIFGMLSILLATLAGCNRPLSRGEKGALIGGGAGALVGGLAGGGTGAAIGAATGAAAGGIIGHTTRKCRVYYSNGKCKQYNN